MHLSDAVCADALCDQIGLGRIDRAAPFEDVGRADAGMLVARENPAGEGLTSGAPSTQFPYVISHHTAAETMPYCGAVSADSYPEGPVLVVAPAVWAGHPVPARRKRVDGLSHQFDATEVGP